MYSTAYYLSSNIVLFVFLGMILSILYFTDVLTQSYFEHFGKNSQENTCVGAPTQALVLSCKLCKIFHNNFLTKKLRPTASGNDKLNHNGEQERAGYPISMSSLTNLYFFQNFKSLTGTFYHKMRLYKFYKLFCFKRQAVYIHDKLKLVFVSCSP